MYLVSLNCCEVMRLCKGAAASLSLLWSFVFYNYCKEDDGATFYQHNSPFFKMAPYQGHRCGVCSCLVANMHLPTLHHCP